MSSLARRTVLQLSIPAILGGCIGATNRASDEQGNETPILTETMTSTEITTKVPSSSRTPNTETFGTENCPIYLSVEVATEEQLNEVEETIDFQDLHPDRQEEFLEARRNTDIEIGIVMPPTWQDPVIVHYEGAEDEDNDYMVTAYTC